MSKTYTKTLSAVPSVPRNLRLRSTAASGGGSSSASAASGDWLPRATFEELFEKVETGEDTFAIRAKADFYSDGAISALGMGEATGDGESESGSGSAGGGASSEDAAALAAEIAALRKEIASLTADIAALVHTSRETAAALEEANAKIASLYEICGRQDDALDLMVSDFHEHLAEFDRANAQLQQIAGDYLPKSGGTITGSLTVKQDLNVGQDLNVDASANLNDLTADGDTSLRNVEISGSTTAEEVYCAALHSSGSVTALE